MTNSPTYTVNNPASGTHYYAPSPYWVIPNAGTSVRCVVQAWDSNGNLKTVSSMTAAVNDQTTQVNESTFTGSGVNRVEAQSSSGTNGSDIFRPGGWVGQSGVARITMYLVYTGHSYNLPPEAPSSLTPADNSQVSSLTPTFTGSFSDPDAGDQLGKYEIVVNDAGAGGGAQIWDSGQITASNTEKAAGAFSKVYAGTALSFAHTYSWRARVADQNNNWGPYSAWLTFTTAQGPNTPTSVAPTGTQVTTTPAISFGYSHPNGTAMAKYHYKIRDATTLTQLYDSGDITQSANNNTTVTGTVSASAGLTPGGNYFFDVYAIDTLGISSPTARSAFNLATLPIAVPTAPINNATATTTTPTFQWSYSDPNYTQASYQVQVLNRTTGATIKDTGQTAGAAQQYTLSGTTISFGTPIQWRVRVWDTAGLVSDWSDYAFALVNNVPTVTITSPTNLGTITTATPTITWNYTASSSGSPQASATVTLKDADGNTIKTATIAGTGTSYTVPAGILVNGKSFKVQVSVLDGNGVAGASGDTTFAVAYEPPPDMQGQSLPAGKNYLINAHLTTDSNLDGTPDNWAFGNSGSPAPTGTCTIDPGILHQMQRPDGNGPFTGATRIAMNTSSGSGSLIILQSIQIAAAGWTPNVTHISAAVSCIVDALSGAPFAQIHIKFFDTTDTQIGSNVTGAAQSDTNGDVVRLLGPQNLLVPTGTKRMEISLRFVTNAAGATGSAWFFDAQLEAVPNIIPTNASLHDGTTVATGWSFSANANVTVAFSIDTTVANPAAGSNGVQEVTLTANSAGAGGEMTNLFRDLPIAANGLTPGADHIIGTVLAKVSNSVGILFAEIAFKFLDSVGAAIGSDIFGGAVTGTSFTASTTASTLIPANAVTVRLYLRTFTTNGGDLGSVWWMDAVVYKDAVHASDPNTIIGDLGTGYFFDGNGYSLRIPLGGNAPAALANPGDDSDPVDAQGGSLTVTWDTSLADANFLCYLLERRRQDDAGDDAAWELLATITNPLVNSYTDMRAGSNVAYQYSVRQQKTYSDGSTGISTHRAIVVASVNFSPVWYVVNADDPTVINVRLTKVGIDRDFPYNERAVYSDFLGRVGVARDAGPPAGYTLTLIAYYDDMWGDDRQVVRRRFIEMFRLNTIWYVKDPQGLVVPCHLGSPDIHEQDSYSDTLLTVTLTFAQADDTNDF